MNKKNIAIILIVLLVATFFSTTISVSAPAASPVASAGPDQAVKAGTLVTLDGTASHDPDNNLPLTYEWSIQSKPANSAATLSSTTADKPTFTPDKPGDYVFALNVTDSLGLKSTTFDTVKITASPTTLTATASATRVVINQKFTVSGALMTAYAPVKPVAGQPVYLEASRDGTTWSRVSANKITGAQGQYSYNVWITAAGTYYMRAHFVATSDYAGSVSDPITVTVT